MNKRVGRAIKPEEILAEVGGRLMRHFGKRNYTLRERPLDNIVWTVLSQNTTDRAAELAYRQLRRRYPSWRQVLSVPRKGIEDTIRVSGLARQKAHTILLFLRRLKSERGNLSLAFLRRMHASEAMKWLTASNGVGTKTAAVLLLFSFGKPVFPVDTHIRRITCRLGFVPQGTPAHKVQDFLSPMVPASAPACAQLHLGLIQLGREICHAPAPECRICPLHDLCRHARRRK